MREDEPTRVDIWLARGLLMIGLWFGLAGVSGLISSAPELSPMLAELPGIGAGALFLVGAWRLRAALRWEPSDDE